MMVLIDKDKVYIDLMREMFGTGYQSQVLSIVSKQPEIKAVPIVCGHIRKRDNGIAFCSVCGANQHESYDAALEECHYCYSCGIKFNMEE